ncbi:MAG: beta-carotene ketolase [Brevundimonas sp.]|nr:MAG: beta-carotene ketolase [Brevundimonas sp.]
MVASSEPYVAPRQALKGLMLAAALIGAWLGLHIYGVYLYRWTGWSILVASLCVAVQTWLSVGLFIVAHDAMHGSLAPGRPALNAAIGRFCLAIYAGFRFDRLKAAHFEHHRAPGTADDPDFHPDDPRAFGAWFLRFFRTYFGWGQMAIVTAYLIAALVLGARLPNLLAFWAAPALLSALQLFTFGTWLPHRSGDQPFADHHNARSTQFGDVLSLLTCFHFGRHHQHHEEPWRPWWRLKGL